MIKLSLESQKRCCSEVRNTTNQTIRKVVHTQSKILFITNRNETRERVNFYIEVTESN